MEEKIEQILEKHSVTIKHGPSYPKVLSMVGQQNAAAEIAKLFDQQLQSEHEEIRIRTKREAELVAQVAELEQRLAWAEEDVNGG